MQPVDGFSSSACACGITTLNHKSLDNAMKYSIIIITSSRELIKILAGVGSMLIVELHCEIALTTLL